MSWPEEWRRQDDVSRPRMSLTSSELTCGRNETSPALRGQFSSFSPSFISRIMDLSSVPRLRLTRHSQLSPFDDDLSRTPTAGPSRLHAFHDESEDTDATPRLTVSSSLPFVYPVTGDTPAARLRALLAQVPNTSSSSRTQLLHEPSPSLPSDRESDFEPPPRWANSSANSSSARESLRSLFTHALRDPGDTPRKGVRRNSIDLSEVEDSPRNGRVMEERARNKGKRMSFSDEELDKSSRKFGIRPLRSP